MAARPATVAWPSRGASATACREAGLPGQSGTRRRADRKSAVATFKPDHTPHVLRHSWASWHYALHKDSLLLARDGGWASTALVERYAHLMSAGQEEAIRRVWGGMWWLARRPKSRDRLTGAAREAADREG